MGAASVLRLCALLLLLAPGFAWACKCLDTPDKRGPDAVFVGRVTSLSGGGATVEPLRVHKGELGPTVRVNNLSLGSCGYPLRAGSTYLISALKTAEGVYTINVCAGSTRELSSGEAPGTGSLFSESSPLLWAAVLLGLALVAWVFWSILFGSKGSAPAGESTGTPGDDRSA
jgi:hypothetical protein